MFLPNIVRPNTIDPILPRPSGACLFGDRVHCWTIIYWTQILDPELARPKHPRRPTAMMPLDYKKTVRRPVGNETVAVIRLGDPRQHGR